MSELAAVVEQLIEMPSFKLFSLDYTVSLFSEERLKHFQELAKDTDRLHIYDFVQFSLQVIQEEPSERVFLSYGLLKLFEEICKNINKDSISFLDFTSFVVDKLPKITQDVKIQEKLLPFGLQIPQQLKRKLIAPAVYGKRASDIKRLEAQFTYSDKHHHLNYKIEKAFFSPSCGQFITLDSPSKELQLFDEKCNLLRTIETQLQLANREAVILSFAWAEPEKRAGCILANYSSSFWSSVDNFRFEINVPLKRELIKNPPTIIYYLACERLWLKLDSKPNIYILSGEDFEIADRFQHSKLKCEKDERFIFSEATYHKLFVIAFDRTVLMLSVSRKEIVSEINNFKTDIYTMCFSEAYQTLLVGCFETYFSSYELSEFCDLTEKGRFEGHRSCITALSTMQNTPIVISIQDDCTVKLWDIRDMTCFQTLIAPLNIVYTDILTTNKGVCFVGSKLFSYNYEQTPEITDNPRVLDVRMVNNRLMVVSTLLVSFFNIDTGRAHRVIKAVFQEEEILACQYLQNQNLIILISAKGLMKAVDAENGSIVTEMQVPDGRPIKLKYEDDVKILFYCSEDAICLYQHSPKQSTFELKRSISHHDDYIRVAECSCLHDLIAFTYGGNVLYFYTHERSKPIGSLLLNSPAYSIQFLKRFKLLCALTEHSILVISYTPTSNSLAFTIRYQLEYLWPKDVVSGQLWQNEQELLVGSDSGQLLILSLQQFKGEPLVPMFDKNNYNPYRVSQESHTEGFRRYKPMLSRKQVATDVQIDKQLRLHRHRISGVLKYGKMLVTADIAGIVKLTTEDGALTGKMHILNPLPEFWSSNKEKKTEVSQMEFVLEILEHLKRKNPKFSDIFNVTDFLKTVPERVYLTEAKPKSRGAVRSLSLQSKNSGSQKVISSLREKKITIDKVRQERRNEQNYQSLVKQTVKTLNFKSQVEDLEKNKDTIAFFDENAIQTAQNRNIKLLQIPPQVKALSKRLDTLVGKGQERSFINDIINRSKFNSMSPIKVPTESPVKRLQQPLSFYSSQLIRDRNQPKNALQLVKSLKIQLFDSKFSRRSTSLPKIKSVQSYKSN